LEKTENNMKQYIDALTHILENGKDRDDRTGVGTRGVFGYQMRFDLRNEFPAVTTKKLAWKSVVSELLWMLEGSSDERRLAEIHFGKSREELVGKNTIWTANANEQGVALGYTDGQLGPVYGEQWRSWRGKTHHVDQIIEVMKNIYDNPSSRRHIVSAWNAAEVDRMALPPCHTLFQFHVQDGELSCQLYQRSADMFLGVPFNIASYSLLTHLIAKLLRLKVGDFIWTGGDCHIYNNHMEQVNEQIKRVPVKGPTLWMPDFQQLGEVMEATPDQFKLLEYNPMDTIKAPMAV
jgi:thymidylate synthase